MDYLKLVWRGDEALRVVFWKYFVTAFLMFAAGIIGMGALEGAEVITVPQSALNIYGLFFSIILLFLSIALFRSAKKYQGNKYLRYGAMIFGIGHAIKWGVGIVQFSLNL